MKKTNKKSKSLLSVLLIVLAVTVTVRLHGSVISTPERPFEPSIQIEIAGSDGGSTMQPSLQQSKSSDIKDAPTKTLSNAPKQAEVKKSVAVEYQYRALKGSNDPAYSSSWALQKVNAPTAWDTATGNNQTIVAVIDTGFALAHEDLTDAWHLNTAENGTTAVGDRCWTGTALSKKTNNCDDDNNGYSDDWRGWDFYSTNNQPQAGETNSNGSGVSHGTSVAGLVGATGNNNKGVATINWATKIMPLQALSDDGVGYTSDITAAIYYAVDNGASVINMSLGGDTFDQSISTAIAYAYQNNVVVVAAAGNCGTGAESGCDPQKPGALAYPATENHVISVGATTQSDLRASFSSNGAGLDVVAPGSGSIVSTAWSAGNQTAAYSANLYGTSFASPQVASLASLIESIRPSATVDDITALILAGSSKLGAMNSQIFTNEYGHGIINASSGLTIATALNNTSLAEPQLSQTGGYSAEHIYVGNEFMGSGCGVATNTYCTVWLKNSLNNYDRYLPYTLAISAGSAGWSWNSGILSGSGLWTVRAVQGQSKSLVPYSLTGK